jgi:hypothetical protein
MPDGEPEPEPAVRKGTVMQIAITAEARVIRAADITKDDQEEPEDG